MSELDEMRYGNRPARVSLSVRVFALGLLLSYASFSAMLGAFMGASSGTREAYPGVIFYALGVAFIPVALLGSGLGVAAAYLLRPVANQWIHILAFAGAGGLAGVLFPVLISMPSFAIVLAPMAAIAAGIGRLSVWRLATVHR